MRIPRINTGTATTSKLPRIVKTSPLVEAIFDDVNLASLMVQNWSSCTPIPLRAVRLLLRVINSDDLARINAENVLSWLEADRPGTAAVIRTTPGGKKWVERNIDRILRSLR